jgi:hypothetical protein
MTRDDAGPDAGRENENAAPVAPSRAGARKPGRPKGDAEGAWKPAFLEALRGSANVAQACRRANVSRSTLYRARAGDPGFAEEMDAAVEESVDLFEGVVAGRALHGSTRTRVVERRDGDGRLVETITETVTWPETRALLRFLAAHRPEKWGRSFDPRRLAAALAGASPR